jgi:hypothetical protein
MTPWTAPSSSPSWPTWAWALGSCAGRASSSPTPALAPWSTATSPPTPPSTPVCGRAAPSPLSSTSSWGRPCCASCGPRGFGIPVAGHTLTAGPVRGRLQGVPGQPGTRPPPSARPWERFWPGLWAATQPHQDPAPSHWHPPTRALPPSAAGLAVAESASALGFQFARGSAPPTASWATLLAGVERAYSKLAGMGLSMPGRGVASASYGVSQLLYHAELVALPPDTLEPPLRHHLQAGQLQPGPHLHRPQVPARAGSPAQRQPKDRWFWCPAPGPACCSPASCLGTATGLPATGPAPGRRWRPPPCARPTPTLPLRHPRLAP